MKSPFQKVSRFIKQHSMLDGARGLLVAVSGGADSVALLDMLLRLSLDSQRWSVPVGEREAVSMDVPGKRSSHTRPLMTPLHIRVAHLDHMLRGRESAEDAEFVRRLTDRLGIEIMIHAVDVRAAALESGRGIEDTARRIRYDFLANAAREADCDRIAVGHTMTDQAETFLMRLSRGAGLRGLAAMRPVVPAHSFSTAQGEQGSRGAEEQGSREAEKRRSRGAEEQRSRGAEAPRLLSSSAARPLFSSALELPVSSDPLLPISPAPAPVLIRPLLCITREEVQDYCRQRGLEFRTDATNLSLNYTRNRVRSEVLPALRGINPQIVESISRAAQNVAGDEEVLAGLASSLLTEARLKSDGPPFEAGLAAYSTAAILAQPSGMRRRMIIEAIRQGRAGLNCESTGGAGEVVSAHVAAVETLLKPEASGKRVVLTNSLEVWREFDALVFKAGASAIETPYQSAITSSCRSTEAGGFALTLERGLPLEQLSVLIDATRCEKERSGQDWMTVALDDQALPEDLVIRTRLRGERALVVGQRRTIKLKNLMINHRIPSSRRATWPLVTTPDGRYIWSPGLPPSVEFAAHVETRSLAIMRASAI